MAKDRVELTPAELDELATQDDDRAWWNATGACGGCGSPYCHRGKACIGTHCTRCPSRDTPDTEGA